MQFQVLTGALLCIRCNLEVKKCNFVFIASGQQISGMIIEPKESFKIQQSFIQFRISSMNSSGLTNVVNESSVIYVVSQCKLAGSNLVQSSNNGYIASALLVHISLNITQFDVCVDSTSRFGSNSVQISTIGSEIIQCDICDQQFVVYGLCAEELKYSENVNGMYQCVYPFEYVDNQCICSTGYLLNKTKCVNVVESLNIMNNLIRNCSNDQIKLLEQKVDKIENSLNILDQSILSNVSEVANRIISNFSKSDLNLFMNTSVLDERIYQNISSVKNEILMKYITADTNLQTNTTVLDWRIFNNVSQLQNTMNNFTQYYNDSLLNMTQIIEKQQNIIDNLTKYINCSSNSGYSMVNGSCIQVSCSISGQQSINGICQCVNINSIVQAGLCVCPTNSQVLGIACVCSISGQIMQNGQCVCSTVGAFVENNVCTCGVNSFNMSNTCRCPSGASLVNGVCTCTNVNAYISGDKCVCPTNSSLVGNTCTCNQIIDQIMSNGVCQCLTNGAFVNNGACTCGVNALNISNICTCPINSSLVSNICTCDKILGQSIINGYCVCPFGQSIINDSCKQIYQSINITSFECSLEVFSQSFDIQSITNQISSSSNFSAGYVFSTATVVQNSFIDISDNVYSTTVYPLFQSQSTFTNLKIQFGTLIMYRFTNYVLIFCLNKSDEYNFKTWKTAQSQFCLIVECINIVVKQRQYNQSVSQFNICYFKRKYHINQQHQWNFQYFRISGSGILYYYRNNCHDRNQLKFCFCERETSQFQTKYVQCWKQFVISLRKCCNNEQYIDQQFCSCSWKYFQLFASWFNFYYFQRYKLLLIWRNYSYNQQRLRYQRQQFNSRFILEVQHKLCQFFRIFGWIQQKLGQHNDKQFMSAAKYDQCISLVQLVWTYRSQQWKYFHLKRIGCLSCSGSVILLFWYHWSLIRQFSLCRSYQFNNFSQRKFRSWVSRWFSIWS
ncbi:Conserved_hypothetical protein [Hexamita inflata]|uniref:Uncharacterized protein n=1 Tax=Hexamita inflata TaxID=28002 RepID=A0AA86QEU1_9EUKA|nr:Conserved hypothetical protein [Hexamita inflata]